MRRTRTIRTAWMTRARETALLLALLSLGPACLPTALTAAEPMIDTEARKLTIAENLIDRLVQRYESEHSYRISFRQESYWALADSSIYSNGVLLLERPARLSVKYDDGSTIVADGDSLWVYMAGTNQYISTEIEADDTIIDPPRVLRQYAPDPSDPYEGPDDIADAKGDIRPHASGITEAKLHLVARDAASEPARVEVTMDPSRDLVTGMTAHTRSGDFTRYEITGTEFGVRTAPRDFRFVRPRGAERVGG
jgi:hypothetical protein